MNRLATQASVDAITADDCKEFVNSLVRSGNLVVAVAGDFEPAEMEALLNSTIGTLPKLAEPLPAIPQPDHTPEPGVYVINKPDVNQGRVSIGHLGYKLGDPDQFPLMVGNDILGGGGFTARMMKTHPVGRRPRLQRLLEPRLPGHHPGNVPRLLPVQVLDLRLCGRDLLRAPRRHAHRTTPPKRSSRTAKTSFIETFPTPLRFGGPDRSVSSPSTSSSAGRHSYWIELPRQGRGGRPADEIEEAMTKDLDPDKMIMLVVGNIEEIMAGHPEHEASLTDFGEITELPLRDPMTLEPIVE